MGKKFADNPKYLLLYLAGLGRDLDLVWIGESNVQPMIPGHRSVRFVARGSLAAWREMLTAGTSFLTHGHGDIASFNVMRGARCVYLGHGLAIKHMGSRDKPLGNRFLSAGRRLLRHSYSYQVYAASSLLHRDKLLAENVTCNITPDQVLDCGQPRVDFLLRDTAPDRTAGLKARFLAAHELPPASRVITYLPTFRDKGQPAFSFSVLEPHHRARFSALLTEFDAVVLEKSHFAGALRSDSAGEAGTQRIFNVSSSAEIDTQELLLITDVLITDYSGCFVDFLVLNRPVIHYAYDRDYYENKDRGLYFKLDEVAGGPIVMEVDTLITEIGHGLRDPDNGREKREALRLKVAEFERGTACEQLARTVLELETA